MMNFKVLSQGRRALMVCGCLSGVVFSLAVANGDDATGCWKTVYAWCGAGGYSGMVLNRNCGGGSENNCPDVIINDYQKRDYRDVGPGNPGVDDKIDNNSSLIIDVQLRHCVDGVCQDNGGPTIESCIEHIATGDPCTGASPSS